MLALSTEALARLVQAARALPPKNHQALLEDFATRAGDPGIRDPSTEDLKRIKVLRRRAEDARRRRERRRRGAVIIPVEIDGWIFGLMERFVALRPETTDPQAVAVAFGRLLQLALVALLRSQNKA
jgi:hypothetical protein